MDASSQQKLPPKEHNTLFNQVLPACQQKNYKKTVTLCDLVLSKFPLNGETLAMKALALSNTPSPDGSGKNKEEAWALVRQGVRMNQASHVTWHAFGLMLRADRKYGEAVKCFLKASKRDRNNVNILSELSSMQMCVGDWEGNRVTRERLLRVAATEANWLAFAVSLHLSGHPSKAGLMLDSFVETLGESKTRDTYAHSELHLYRNELFRESGQLEEAVKHAEEMAGAIRDSTALKENKACCLLELGRKDEARAVYEELLDENPENALYHYRIWRCAGAVESDEEARRPPARCEVALAGLHAAVAEKYPRAALSTRLPLTFLAGGPFLEAADAYMRRGISRGVPSLFRDISDLYGRPERKAVIAELAESYVENLRATGTFDGCGGAREPPSALMFALYLLAQHLDACGDHPRALEVVAEAVAHTPTAMDLYALRARIYSHAGDRDMAFVSMDRARQLDTADRYLNIKTVKYALQAGRLDEAEHRVHLFLRDDDVLVKTLDDLQMSWYQLDAGRAHQRAGRLGRALRMFANVDRHFDVINEDQMEFYNYCWRRGYVRASVDTSRWCSSQRKHLFFYEAATGMIEIYLDLHQNPGLAGDAAAAAEQESKERKEEEEARRRKEEEDDAELAGLSKEERRRVLRARRKAAYRNLDPEAAKEKEEKAEAAEKKADAAAKALAEADVEGVKLLAVPNKLNEALRRAEQLVEFCGDRVGSHTLAMRAYLDKGRPLLALRALRRARAVDADDPGLHVLSARLLVALPSAKLGEAAAEVVRGELDDLGMADAPAFATAYAARAAASMPHRLAAAEAACLLGASGVDHVALASDLSGDGVTHGRAARAVEFLRGAAGEPAAADALLARARDRFPLAVQLMADDARAARDARLAEEAAANDAVRNAAPPSDDAK